MKEANLNNAALRKQIWNGEISVNTKRNKIETQSLEISLELEVVEKWYYPIVSPFSKHYRKKLNVLRTPLADRIVLDHMVSTQNPKLVFTKNSKAACTSIAHAMYYVVAGCQYDGKIHQKSEILSQGRDNWDKLLTRRAAPDYTTFTFVRHPIDRLESAFRDFVIERRNPSLVYHAAGLEKIGCSKDKSENDNLDAFLDYVEASFEASRIRSDRHWRPQVDNIGLGRFSYDFIGRVENLQEDLRKLFAKAGVEERANNHATSIRKNSSHTSNRISNKAQSKRIQKLYAADFEAFDYD